MNQTKECRNEMIPRERENEKRGEMGRREQKIERRSEMTQRERENERYSEMTQREREKERYSEMTQREREKEGYSEMPADLLREPSAAAAYVQGAGHPRPEGTAAYQQGAGHRQPGEADPRIPAGEDHNEADYYALPDDLRVEMIEGVFYAMASPSKLHQAVAFEIARQLADCIDRERKPCFLYIAPSDVALGEDGRTIVQPDLYVHCTREKEQGTGPHRGAPDFVLEVLSPSNPEHDLWLKRNLYQQYGVREYWIVDPLDLSVYVFAFEMSADPEKYYFDSIVPVRISNDFCTVDFHRIHEKIKHLL